jgi:WD40 repeat protein
LEVSQDGNTLIGGGDSNVIIWSWNSKKWKWERIRTLTGHSQSITSLVISPNGKNLISSSENQTVKFWDLETGKEINTFLKLDRQIKTIAISPDGETLITSDEIFHQINSQYRTDSSIKIWDIHTGNLLTEINPGYEMGKLVISSDSKILMTCSRWGEFLKIWDLNTGEHLTTLGKDSQENWVSNVAIASDELIVTQNSRSIKVWGIP